MDTGQTHSQARECGMLTQGPSQCMGLLQGHELEKGLRCVMPCDLTHGTPLLACARTSVTCVDMQVHTLCVCREACMWYEHECECACEYLTACVDLYAWYEHVCGLWGGQQYAPQCSMPERLWPWWLAQPAACPAPPHPSRADQGRIPAFGEAQPGGSSLIPFSLPLASSYSPWWITHTALGSRCGD